LHAMKTVQKGGLPQGVVPKEHADEMVKIQSFTGIRAKGVI